MAQDVLKRLRKHQENDQKWLPNALKYIGKIDSTEKYDDYKKKITILLIEWFIDTQIRAVLFCAVIFCLSAGVDFLTTPTKLALAEGSSIIWFLLVELKRELWRK